MAVISRILRTAALAALAAVASVAAQAQTFPTKPIRFIVPYPAGGPTDLTARIVAEKLASVLGQPVVIENRGGAGSAIGTTALFEAPPDGYTIGLLTPAATTLVHFQDNVPWRATNFVPLANMADVPLFIAVHPSVKANTLQELFALIKTQPGKLNYSTAGYGVITHLAFEWLKLREGLDITYIPYQGAADSLRDVAAGQVQVTYEGGAGVIPLAKEGRLRALAVTGTERFPAAPEVPTMAEAGVENFEISSWFAAFAPPRTPKEIAARLEAAIIETLQDARVRQRIIDSGQTPSGQGSEWVADAVKTYSDRWARVVSEANIKPR